jgi:DNA helicase-2/ATP-dependent DNA helicase PcrA
MRVRRHLEDLIPEDPALGDMSVSTIHAFCMQILKELKPEFRNFEVIDEEQQGAFLVANFYDLRLQVLRQNYGLNYFETIRTFKNTLSAIYLENLNVQQLKDKDLKESILLYYDILGKWPMCFLDFNSIIGKLIFILNTDKLTRSVVQDRIKYLIVDEYQDIDPRQEELIQLLIGGGAHLCVVGDDDQAIYGWRGADVKNILTFKERYKKVKKVELVENFRSSHAVVEIANAAARKLSSRLPKAMKAVHIEQNNGQEVFVETMTDKGDIHHIAFSNEKDEAEYIASRIIKLRGVEIDTRDGKRGLDWGDMAILFRSVKNYAGVVVDTLREHGIPVVVKGIRGLFEHDEIKLIQAILHLIVGTDLWKFEGKQQIILKQADLRKMIRSLVVSLSSVMPGMDEAKLMEWIATKQKAIDQAKLPKGERPHNVSRRIYPQDLFHDILEALGASRNQWDDTVLYNLGRLSGLLTKYEAIHQWIQPSNLKELLLYLNNWSLEDGGPNEIGNLNAVQVLTIHSAKGLEWPVVFIPSIFSYHFPSSKRNSGLDTFLGAKYASGDDGERRLWYVALTRSQKFLNITSMYKPRRKPTDFFLEVNHSYALATNTDPTERKRTTPQISASADLLPTTYSDIGYYWKCPFDYKLRKIMGFGPSIGQEFGYGQQVHNLLAAIHEAAKQGRTCDKKTVTDLVEKNFSLRYTTGEPFERMKEAADRTLGNYIDKFGKSLPKLVLEAEKPFEFILEGALISGTIDLLERLDNSSGMHIPVCVVDFKTGIPEDKEEFDQRLADSERQVTLYAIAARDGLRLNPKKARVSFLDTKELVDREIKIDESSKKELIEHVGDTVRKIKLGRFPKTPIKGKKSCKNCDFCRVCNGA